MSRNHDHDHDHAAHTERMLGIAKVIGVFAALPPAERRWWLAELRRRYGEGAITQGQ